MNLVRIVITGALLAQAASAAVVTLATSDQPLLLTGTGVTPTGSGTSRVTLGACTFGGQNTTCVLSGAYSGGGVTGTYQFKLVYPGNGPSPLSAITSPATSNFFSLSLSAGSLAFTLSPVNGTTTQYYDLNGSIVYNSLAGCTGVVTCSVGSVGQSQGGTITGAVTGSFDTTPLINNIVSASAYGGFMAIAPATWIEIYGMNLATTAQQTWATSDFTGLNAPTALGGTTVTVGGKPAFIDYVSPHQVNVQVPSGIPTGTQTVVVTTAGGPSVGTMVTVNTVEPGVLAPPVFMAPAGQYAVALFPDGVTYAMPPGFTSAVPTARAKPGDTLILYGVGFGAVTPNINAGTIVQQSNSLAGLQVFIGGKQATLQFAGLVSGFLGLYQFNIVVPSVPASDATTLVFSLNDGAALQSLILPIGN